MKLGLGTVQFGLDYGVSNSGGRVPLSEVQAILNLAGSSGIKILDTASLYGESEGALGACMTESHQFNIVTKTPALKNYTGPRPFAEHVRETFLDSLKKMRLSNVYGLLVHHADDLVGLHGGEILGSLQDIKREGLVKKIGVSVYDGAEIDAVLERMVPDIVQIPLNPFDQRLIASGDLRKLKNLGVEIHARSLFLQGILLMKLTKLPGYFKPIASHLAAYNEYLESNGLSRLEGALCFIQQQSEVDVGLVGVTSCDELKQIAQATVAVLDRKVDFSIFAVNDEAYINPAKWKVL